MANTLTNLIPDAYAALNVVSRELVGFIPAVTRNPTADRLAIGQTLRSAVAPINSSGADITPAMAIPAAADQVIGNVPFVISKARRARFSWSGEEVHGVNQGPGYLTIKQQQIAQAIRALVNEMESDLATTAYLGASRAFGTAGTTPFQTNLGESAQLKKVLDDNGAPLSDRHLVIGTTAGAALRTLLNNPLNANASLAGDMVRQGVLLDVNGFAIRESAQVKTAAIGTGASYLVNNGAGYAIGDTSITVDGGTGTILAGDVITFAADTANKYVVKTALTANVVVIQEPGLRVAIPDNNAITVAAIHASNVGFSRDALLLGTRLPMLPEEGDLAIMRETITDPLSGISFELAVYPGYRMNVYEIAAAWGTATENARHSAILLG